MYTFSDGILDQKGGEKGKKFTRGRLKKLLLEIQTESIEKQGKLVQNGFIEWKGKQEQIDDVVMIGIQFEIS